MDINEAIFGRRSTRNYTAQALDQEVLRRLIDAAIHAPSAVSLQANIATIKALIHPGRVSLAKRALKSAESATTPAVPPTRRANKPA